MTHRALLFSSFALFTIACATTSADRQSTSPEAGVTPAARVGAASTQTSDAAATGTPDAAATGTPDAAAPKDYSAQLGAEDDPCYFDPQSKCMDDGMGECCPRASIKYRYEMLDARRNGDAEAEKDNRDQLEKVLSHGCDLEDEESCVRLEKYFTPSR